MNKHDEILKRQSTQIRFHNKDMDFVFNWLLGTGSLVGLSHGELFAAVDGMKDGDAGQWRERLGRQAARLLARADSGESRAAAQSRLAAAFCLRAVLQYSDMRGEGVGATVTRMEHSFLSGAAGLGVPLRAIEVPFEGKTLPGYLLEHDGAPRPMLVMVGGGDTFREDLFTFAGYPAWRRGYNALMVDLPGQGCTPSRGLTFRVDMAAPISAVLDFMATNVASPPPTVALYGVSGGGYFTAQAASDPRVGAWVASTPITDMAELFRKEFGAAQRVPGWFMRLALSVAGAVNESAELNLAKYAWQFGTSDFKSAVDQVFLQARVVDVSGIKCPCLFLVGASEAAELQRQAVALTAELRGRGVEVALRTFTADEGADVHCQVSNPKLAHAVIFDWLERVVSPRPPPVDPRLGAW